MVTPLTAPQSPTFNHQRLPAPILHQHIPLEQPLPRASSWWPSYSHRMPPTPTPHATAPVLAHSPPPHTHPHLPRPHHCTRSLPACHNMATISITPVPHGCIPPYHLLLPPPFLHHVPPAMPPTPCPLILRTPHPPSPQPTSLSALAVTRRRVQPPPTSG